MGMISAAVSLLSGGLGKSIENIASEWIQTDLESAEAKVLMIKTLDPNGSMRRRLSDRVASLYTTYLYSMLALLAIEFFCALAGIDVTAVATTTDKLTPLFLPITGLFGAIVTASFGVNYTNIKQESK